MLHRDEESQHTFVSNGQLSKGGQMQGKYMHGWRQGSQPIGQVFIYTTRDLFWFMTI